MLQDARSLENVMLNKRSQSQRTTYCTIPFIGNVQNRQIYRQNLNQWLPMAEGSKMGMTTNRYGVSLGNDKNFLKPDYTTVNILRTIGLYKY